MDLGKYINLIVNHGYKGKIGIAKVDIGGMCSGVQKGELLLYRPYEERSEDKWNKTPEELEWISKHCSIEQPYSEEVIQKNLSEGSCLKTFCTMAGVPLSYIEEVVTSIEPSKSKISIYGMSTEDRLTLLKDLIDSFAVVTAKGSYGAVEWLEGADFEIDPERENSIIVETRIALDNYE